MSPTNEKVYFVPYIWNAFPIVLYMPYLIGFCGVVLLAICQVFDYIQKTSAEVLKHFIAPNKQHPPLGLNLKQLGNFWKKKKKKKKKKDSISNYHHSKSIFVYETGPIQFIFSQHSIYWWPDAWAPAHQLTKCRVHTQAFSAVNGFTTPDSLELSMWWS